MKLKSNLLAAATFALATFNAHSQSTTFTYQGRLNSGGGPVSGNYDFRFRLAADPLGNSYISTPFLTNAIPVTNGLFLTTLDFGAGIFTGSNYWLEVDVRTNGAGSYTALAPLQAFTATPYAIFATTASNVAGTISSAQVSGVLANAQLANSLITVNAGTGLGGGGTVALGGSTTITNAGVVAVNGNSDITADTLGGVVTLGSSGTSSDVVSTLVKRDNAGGFSVANLTVDNNVLLPATTGTSGIIYSGGLRLIHTYGSQNFFAGALAGNFSVTGYQNTGVGWQALFSLTSGINNTAVGVYALESSKDGNNNTALGYAALSSNIGGGRNTGLGASALGALTNGFFNVAIGYNAMQTRISGDANTAVGSAALASDTTGIQNTAIGDEALFQNTNAFNNIALGYQAGINVLNGNNIIEIGNPGTDGDSNLIRIGTPGVHLTTFLAGVINGNGNGLTNLNASKFTSGTIPLGQLPAAVLTNNNITAVTLTGSFTGNGANLTNVNAAALGGLKTTNFWQTGGNNVAAGQFLGSTNQQALELWVNGNRALRLAPNNFGLPGVLPNLVGGSVSNSIDASTTASTIGGGYVNVIQGGVSESFIGAGHLNTIFTNVQNAFIGAGQFNQIQSSGVVIAGGESNTNLVGSSDAVIGGGANNLIQGIALYSTISGGINNKVAGNGAAIPGGSFNVASGSDSFAAGSYAQATNAGAFVWSDNSIATPFSSTNNNSFNARAAGGYRLYTTSAGASGAGIYLAANGTAWAAISDRNAKKNFAALDYQAVLSKLATVPITKWNYKWEKDSEAANLGPMAQDFKAAFYPGRDDKSITTLEFDGVELAAIQGLNQKLEEQKAENAELKNKNLSLEQRLEKLERLLTK
jgi:hypothetical protein